MIESACCGYSFKDRTVRTKNNHFRGLRKVNNLCEIQRLSLTTFGIETNEDHFTPSYLTAPTNA